MSFDTESTAQHWSEHTARFAGRKTGLFWWEAGPELRRHANSQISGHSDIDWIEHTLTTHFTERLPISRCLSLGCGHGHLERRLAQLGAFQHCDAYDIAIGSIQVAKQKAEEAGFLNIRYHIADVNDLMLPANSYDAVWINNAMHHFEALEHICGQIKKTLKPKGLFILKEYVGPSRFQFPARQKEIAQLCLHLLPARYRIISNEAVTLKLERSPFKKGLRWFFSRLIDKIRDRDLISVIHRRLRTYQAKSRAQSVSVDVVGFPSVRDVIANDPSEAVRSGDIITVLQQDFEIVERKDWGGNVLQFLLSGIAGSFSTEDPCSQALLRMLTAIEYTLLKCDEFESDFTYIVARPQAGKAIGNQHAATTYPVLGREQFSPQCHSEAEQGPALRSLRNLHNTNAGRSPRTRGRETSRRAR